MSVYETYSVEDLSLKKTGSLITCQMEWIENDI